MNLRASVSELWARLSGLFGRPPRWGLEAPGEEGAPAPSPAQPREEPQPAAPAEDLAPPPPSTPISRHPLPEPEQAAPAPEPVASPPAPQVPAAAAQPEVPLAQTALAPAPDPQREALEAKRTKLEQQLAEFSARRAEMAERMALFELAQYQALGAVVEECLRLRHRLMQLQAAHSGEAEDRAAEAAAEAEFRAYRSVCEETAARPELSEADQDELKRRYRAAAMACHPDRVEEARREAAHALFQRLQQAYRQGDLAGLRALQGEIADTLTMAEAARDDLASLKVRVSRLQDQVADLILAIQTLQLDPNYRQAARQEEWEPFFTAARARFEEECDDLRRRIRALGEAP